MVINIKTTRFGNLNYEENQIITFPEGILGFESNKRFVLYKQKEDSVFEWLQSADDPELAFVVIEPANFRKDYQVPVPGELEPKEECIIYVIVTVPQDPLQITANLKGPIIINLKKQLGKQLVLDNSEYLTRHYIIAELQYMELEKQKARQKVNPAQVREHEQGGRQVRQEARP